MNLPRYGLVFAGVAIGAALLIDALSAATENTLGSSAQLMVPAMIAALVEGQQFAKSEKRRPDTREVWGFTWAATAVATLLNVAIAYLAGGIVPEFGKLAVAAPLSKQFLILLGLYAGGYLICNRLFAGIGAYNKISLMRSRGEVE